MKGAGFKGIGLISPALTAAPLGNPYYNFAPDQTVLTPRMAKRATTVFAAAPIVQGKISNTGVGCSDLLSIPHTKISGFFYNTIDLYQGSIAFRITPEWNGNDGFQHYIYRGNETGTITIVKDISNNLTISNYNGLLNASVDVSGWTAGTTYNVVARWDSKTTLDGTNYWCISINDTHTFGGTSPISHSLPPYLITIGSTWDAQYSANAIIEGLTVYRRVLYDGAYGVNVGNGDEVALISAGIDPCTITGSWDIVFCFPTNSTVGQLSTGTGEAWSHPHSSNLLTDGWLSRGYYGGGQWALRCNGTTTRIDCGSDASLDDLHDGALTVELWVRGNIDRTALSNGALIYKGLFLTNGWSISLGSDNVVWAAVQCATSMAVGASTTKMNDDKYHHVAITWDDAGDRTVRIYIDGKLESGGGAGVGAIISDAGDKLYMANFGNPVLAHGGAFGWVRISNSVRYPANFVPPRVLPAPDGNTVEQWSMNDGTGATAAATVTSPANDGTITDGVWEAQWHPTGTPVIDYSLLGGSESACNVGNNASINNLADNAFTIEGWVRPDKIATPQYIAYKGDASSTGWKLTCASGNIYVFVYCATTTPTISYPFTPDGRWHHVAITFDDAGDRQVRLWLDGVNVATSGAGVGAIVVDAADVGYIGGYPASGFHLGGYGWVRWSNSVRYAAGFTPAPRSNPPSTDANTMAQWNVTEGVGATLADATGVNNGTMSGTYSWGITPAMETDSPGARVFAWGNVFGNDGVDEGIEQTLTGLSAGADYVIRALGYSEDGTGQPEIVIYDETNAAVISRVTGTVTSTEKAPDMLMCSFELPTVARGAGADCTSISIRLINTVATGVVGWHQVELLANLIDNPSFDTGGAADPWIPDGFTGLGLVAGESSLGATIHGGGAASFQLNSGTVGGHGLVENITLASGKFVDIGYWEKCAVLDGVNTYIGFLDATNGLLQYSASIYYKYGNLTTDWLCNKGTGRTTKANPTIQFTASGSLGQNHFLDDAYAIALDDVTLTVTPASAANSVESGGLRIDGYDMAPHPIPANNIFPSFGWVRFKWIPRHNIAVARNFNDPVICSIDLGIANNYIYIAEPAPANTLSLTFNDGGGIHTDTWATGGYFLAGNTYLMEIRWTPGDIQLFVDGVSRITIAHIMNFSIGNIFFFPGDYYGVGYNCDAVFLAP